MDTGECLINVQGVSKKFSRDLKWNMIHGMTDIARLLTGQNLKRDELRKQEFWALNNVSLNPSIIEKLVQTEELILSAVQ